MPILPHIPPAQFLAKLAQLVKPGRTAEQQVMFFSPWMRKLAPRFQRAVVTQEILKPYTEPHTRRQFFKNLVGAPQRWRQIEGVTGQFDQERAGARSNRAFNRAWQEVSDDEGHILGIELIDPKADAAAKRFTDEALEAGERVEQMKSPFDQSPPMWHDRPNPFNWDLNPEEARAWMDQERANRDALDAALQTRLIGDYKPLVDQLRANPEPQEAPHPATEWILNRILGSRRSGG